MTSVDAMSSTTSPPLRRDTQGPRRISQGRYPTRAYGILLDDECLHRWGTCFYNEVYPGKLSKMSPEEARKTVFDVRGATLAQIPRMVYDAFPNLPQLRHNLILMNDAEGIWLFVLKDDSSHSCAHVYLDPEDVKGAKKLLGLQRQVVKWHHVDGWD